MQPAMFPRAAVRGAFVLCHFVIGISVASALRLRHGRDWHLTRTGQASIQWWMQHITRIIGIRIAQYGQPVGRQAFFTANHISFLDIIVISSITPVRFLSKDTIRYWPLVGYLTSLSGTLFIKRGRRSVMSQTLDTLREALQTARPIVVFPEGTTSLGEHVMKFHTGLYQAAIDSNIPVQAIALRYLRDAQPDRISAYIDKDSFVFTLLRIISQPVTHVHVAFCEPITRHTLTRQALAEHTRQQVSNVIIQGQTLPLE